MGDLGFGRAIEKGYAGGDSVDAAEKRIERVLTNDPAMGVVRHADAGYETAIEVAKQTGERWPVE